VTALASLPRAWKQALEAPRGDGLDRKDIMSTLARLRRFLDVIEDPELVAAIREDLMIGEYTREEREEQQKNLEGRGPMDTMRGFFFTGEVMPDEPLREPGQVIEPDLHELKPGELIGSISRWIRNNPDGVEKILESESERAR